MKIENTEEVKRRIKMFLGLMKQKFSEEESLSKVIGILITGGASLIILDEYALATTDIDAYLVKEDNKIDWFYNYMLEPASNLEINDQAAKQLPVLSKLIMLDKEYQLIDTMYGFNIYIPSIETLILTKVKAHIDRNKEKDLSDLQILLSKDFDKDKLLNLSKLWSELIKEKEGDYESQEFNKSLIKKIA